MFGWWTGVDQALIGLLASLAQHRKTRAKRGSFDASITFGASAYLLLPDVVLLAVFAVDRFRCGRLRRVKSRMRVFLA